MLSTLASTSCTIAILQWTQVLTESLTMCGCSTSAVCQPPHCRQSGDIGLPVFWYNLQPRPQLPSCQTQATLSRVSNNRDVHTATTPSDEEQRGQVNAQHTDLRSRLINDVQHATSMSATVVFFSHMSSVYATAFERHAKEPDVLEAAVEPPLASCIQQRSLPCDRSTGLRSTCTSCIIRCSAALTATQTGRLTISFDRTLLHHRVYSAASVSIAPLNARTLKLQPLDISVRLAFRPPSRHRQQFSSFYSWLCSVVQRCAASLCTSIQKRKRRQLTVVKCPSFSASRHGAGCVAEGLGTAPVHWRGCSAAMPSMSAHTALFCGSRKEQRGPATRRRRDSPIWAATRSAAIFQQQHAVPCKGYAA